MNEYPFQRRFFLLRDLPAPLMRASEHLQLFDNYITNTKLRLRATRIPKSNEWSWTLENFAREGLPREILTLDENAFEILKQLSAGEIRKNRYSLEAEDTRIEVDMFLGDLWGVITAKLPASATENPGWREKLDVIAEITGEEFFFGESLATKKFDDVKQKVAEILGDSKK
jgi:CYTH domain-containing protein